SPSSAPSWPRPLPWWFRGLLTFRPRPTTRTHTHPGDLWTTGVLRGLGRTSDTTTASTEARTSIRTEPLLASQLAHYPRAQTVVRDGPSTPPLPRRLLGTRS